MFIFLHALGKVERPIINFSGPLLRRSTMFNLFCEKPCQSNQGCEKQRQYKPVMSDVQLTQFLPEFLSTLPSIGLFELYQGDPVFVSVAGGLTDVGGAGADYLGFCAGLKFAAGTRTEPLYGEHC